MFPRDQVLHKRTVNQEQQNLQVINEDKCKIQCKLKINIPQSK